MKLKISENFISQQGEALYLGVPSIFIRVFGCNFTCGGFGMPRGEISTEHKKIDAKAYTSYGDLPLVKTGCDSFAAWSPEFKHLSPMLETSVIAEQILAHLPTKSFHADEGSDTHLVITGGEPLLGWQRSYPELIRQLPGLKNITFETNGTQELSQQLVDFFNDEMPNILVTFSVSSKLSGASGESQEDALLPDVVAGYKRINNSQMFFKFVCSVMEDIEEAKYYVSEYKKAGIACPVYLMPVGGTEESYNLNAPTVAKLALANGWRYSPRLQVDLYKNAWGT